MIKIKFENPPHGGNYKLIGTYHYKDDIGLLIMEYGQDAKQYFFSDVNKFESKLKNYILNIRDNIIEGRYDLKLLDDEIKQYELSGRN